MKFGNCSNIFLVFPIFCLIIQAGNCLECFACNVSVSGSYDDACKGIGSMKKCVGNSVCLSASYQVQTGLVRTFTTMRSCFPDMAGEECKYFMKSQRDMNHNVATVVENSCYVCNKDNCNRHMYSHAAKSVPSVILIGLVYAFSIIILKPLQLL